MTGGEATRTVEGGFDADSCARLKFNFTRTPSSSTYPRYRDVVRSDQPRQIRSETAASSPPVVLRGGRFYGQVMIYHLDNFTE